MKRHLIKLAKALNLSGYNSYSSRILKIAEELGSDAFKRFDERYTEDGRGKVSINYYPTYSQIANFIQDLEDQNEKSFLVRTFLSGEEIGLMPNLGEENEFHYLNKAKVGFETNISSEKIRDMVAKDIVNKKEHVGLPLDTYGSMPDEIVVRYLISIKEIDFKELSRQTSFNTLNSKLLNNMESIERNFEKYIYDKYSKQSEALDSGESELPRFNYEVKAEYLRDSNMMGRTPMGKQLEGASQAHLMFTVKIKDPVKETVERNQANKKHQEKMKEDDRKAKIVNIAEKEHRQFIEHLSDLKSACLNYTNPEPEPGSPSMAIASHKAKCCIVIARQISKFMNIYGIRNLDNPSSSEIRESMRRNKKYNKNAPEPSVGFFIIIHILLVRLKKF